MSAQRYNISKLSFISAHFTPCRNRYHAYFSTNSRSQWLTLLVKWQQRDDEKQRTLWSTIDAQKKQRTLWSPIDAQKKQRTLWSTINAQKKQRTLWSTINAHASAFELDW